MRGQLFHTAGHTEMQTEWWCICIFSESMWKVNASEVGNIILANWRESNMNLFVRILKTWFRDCFVFIWIQFHSDEGWINLWMFVCGHFRPCCSHTSSWNVKNIFGKTAFKGREMLSYACKLGRGRKIWYKWYNWERMDDIGWRWCRGHFSYVARRLNCVKDHVLEVTNLNLYLEIHTVVTVLHKTLLEISAIREMMCIKTEN